jgi:hypothetical protein
MLNESFYADRFAACELGVLRSSTVNHHCSAHPNFVSLEVYQTDINK